MSRVAEHPDFSVARRIRDGIDRALADSRNGRVADVLRAGSDDPRGAVYVVRLLECVPGVGKVTARRIAAELGHDGFTRVCDLAGSQRDALLTALDGSR